MNPFVLKFLNPTGLDKPFTTVRHGMKWALRVAPGDQVELAQSFKDATPIMYGPATIASVITCPIQDIPADLLRQEHDPRCQGHSGLLEVLREVYGPGVDQGDIVTVLSVIPTPAIVSSEELDLVQGDAEAIVKQVDIAPDSEEVRTMEARMDPETGELETQRHNRKES